MSEEVWKQGDSILNKQTGAIALVVNVSNESEVQNNWITTNIGLYGYQNSLQKWSWTKVKK